MLYLHWKQLFYLGFSLSLLLSPCSVSAKQYPKRIVSLGPINTENVFLLGAGSRMVGDTIYCLRPEGAKHKPKIGSVMQVSIEKIIALRPDLILATALTGEEQTRQLNKLGFNVVRFRQPGSFVEMCGQFIELGKLLGLEKRALTIVNRARDKVDRIKQLTTSLPARAVRPRSYTKVFLQVGTRPLFGAVPGSFINDFITLAGGVNIIEDQHKGTSKLEKIILRNPDVIIIAIMGSESGMAGDEKRKWQKFPVINAVRDNRVFIIPPDLVCSPSPATFTKALTIITGMIHPELKEQLNESI